VIYLNLKPVIPTIFPDNTSQVWHLPEEIFNAHTVEIDWEFDNEGEFMHLAQLKGLLDAKNVRAHLTLKYLPYGRQDKAISNDTTFALTVFAHLLNSLQFTHVAINDPHSSDALKLIYNSYAYYNTDALYNVVAELEVDHFCYPDNGAFMKYADIYDFADFSHGEKVRDQATGNIISFKLIGNPAGKTVLIVDDICDGGATFKILAADLYNAGAKQVFLFVSHGIFSKGLKTLKEAGIQRIFCPDGEVTEYKTRFIYRRL
jgi:ribose-phosphate pyrophosphokinase